MLSITNGLKLLGTIVPTTIRHRKSAGLYVWKKILVTTRQIKQKPTFLHYINTLVAIHHIVPTRLQTICIHFVLYKASQLKNIKWHRGGENLPLFLFCLKELWFFIIPICTCKNSVRKILGNQITFTPSIKVIPFSKYLSFHLGVVLNHANWANLIL